MFQRRKYKVFWMHVFFHSHEGGSHICGDHPHVSGRMHASETPNTTSFQRGQELELRFVGFFCPLAYVWVQIFCLINCAPLHASPIKLGQLTFLIKWDNSNFDTHITETLTLKSLSLFSLFSSATFISSLFWLLVSFFSLLHVVCLLPQLLGLIWTLPLKSLSLFSLFSSVAFISSLFSLLVSFFSLLHVVSLLPQLLGLIWTLPLFCLIVILSPKVRVRLLLLFLYATEVLLSYKCRFVSTFEKLLLQQAAFKAFKVSFFFFSSLCGWRLKCSSSYSLRPGYRHILTLSSSVHQCSSASIGFYKVICLWW